MLEQCCVCPQEGPIKGPSPDDPDELQQSKKSHKAKRPQPLGVPPPNDCVDSSDQVDFAKEHGSCPMDEIENAT